MSPFQSAPKPFASISQAVQERSWIRLVIATSMITVWIAAHVVANLFCYDQTVDSSDDNITIATSSPSSSSSLSSSSSFSDAPSSSLYSLPLATSDSSSLPQSHFLSVDGSCNLPPFLTHFAVLGMIAITVLTRISYIVKTALILSLMVIQICLNLLPLQPSFRWYDTRLYSITVSIGHELTLSVILLTTAVVFILINRQVSPTAGKPFARHSTCLSLSSCTSSTIHLIAGSGKVTWRKSERKSKCMVSHIFILS